MNQIWTTIFCSFYTILSFKTRFNTRGLRPKYSGDIDITYILQSNFVRKLCWIIVFRCMNSIAMKIKEK